MGDNGEPLSYLLVDSSARLRSLFSGRREIKALVALNSVLLRVGITCLEKKSMGELMKDLSTRLRFNGRFHQCIWTSSLDGTDRLTSTFVTWRTGK